MHVISTRRHQTARPMVRDTYVQLVAHSISAFEMSADDDFSLVLDDEPSPSKVKTQSHSRNASRSRNAKKSPEAEKTREDVLRQELASVRKVNEAIEGVLGSLQKAKSNMKVCVLCLVRAYLIQIDRQQFSQCSFAATEYLDQNSFTD